MAERKERCVIVSAAPLAPAMKALLRPGDYLIACDGGYQSTRQILGREPDVILGDFDSAPEPKGTGAVVLPRVKDDTDTHYAARLAVKKGFSQVLLLGALGGHRLEHTLANIGTGLWLEKQGVQVTLADEDSLLCYLMPGRTMELAYAPEEYFSVLPLEGKAEGVCEQGAKYTLQDATLTTVDFPLGVSNETMPGGSSIRVREGALLVIRTKKDHQLDR